IGDSNTDVKAATAWDSCDGAHNSTVSTTCTYNIPKDPFPPLEEIVFVSHENRQLECQLSANPTGSCSELA
ncbi:hypothetical protein, partial [Synechococcus sp. MU1655]|uniref:hypothetical protein n=1 Tax=Synechococcus sp. MU1655 TaxID=2508355 RepID=UPI002026EC11